MEPPAASTAAPDWAFPSAAKSRTCWAAKSGCTACPGEGSTFTLYLPQTYFVAPQHETRSQAPRHRRVRWRPMPSSRRASKPSLLARIDQDDDRETIQPGDHVLLVIDDDPTYSRILLDAAHERGFKAVIATRGDMGLALARKFRPDAVLLDIGLPDTTGWTVLDQLQHDPELRHIPVHVLSMYEDRRRGLSLGAASYFRKAEGREVVDRVFRHIQQSRGGAPAGDPVGGSRRGHAAGSSACWIWTASNLTCPDTGAEALDAFARPRYDCVIVGRFGQRDFARRI